MQLVLKALVHYQCFRERLFVSASTNEANKTTVLALTAALGKSYSFEANTRRIEDEGLAITQPL